MRNLQAILHKSLWELTETQAAFFSATFQETQDSGRPHVLWGWKRDNVVDGIQYPQSRSVYFSADLGIRDTEVFIKRFYFFLRTRAESQEIESLEKAIHASKNGNANDVSCSVEPSLGHKGFHTLTMHVGGQSSYDKSSTTRLLKRKPRLRIGEPRIIEEAKSFDLSEFAPLSIYCGSGLSHESGLPLLGEIHKLFDVDDVEHDSFVFGAKDRLPQWLLNEPEATLRKFCQFSIDAIQAEPSDSHRILSAWCKAGIFQQVFTDNMDSILTRLNVPFTQTRVSIFPDRFPVTFGSAKALLVIGIAVDRRDVIKQARRKGLKIIVINPVFGVAPHSRNIDYLYKGDVFFKATAAEVLPKIDECFRSKFEISNLTRSV